jgi:hypothetical protein
MAIASASALLNLAIARGLTYLHQHQFPNGEFAAYCAIEAPMQGWTRPDSSIFPTALIGSCLLHVAEAPEAEEMLTRATNFLSCQMNHGGLWNHFTELHHLRHICPLDTDDTACVSALLRARGVACPVPTNVPLILSNRTSTGLFYTWFVLRPRWVSNRTYWRVTLPELLHPIKSLLFWYGGEGHRNDIDSVVNANALYYLGDIPETQPVIAHLLRVIAGKKEDDCDVWYRDPLLVYYFFTRCYAAGIGKLEPLREPIISRILAQAKPDGRLGETLLDTAWAVCSLLNLNSYPPELDRAIHYLLEAQSAFGAWPRWLVYYGGPKRIMGWGSEEMTTAFCLEALARYRQHLATSAT